MKANKLRRQIFHHMRDEYGAMCVRINSGSSRGNYLSNYWVAPRNAPDLLEKIIELLDINIVSNLFSNLSGSRSKGFPDTLFLLPSGVTVYAELKTKNDRLSDEQKIFLEMARRLGHIALEVSSVDDIEYQLDSYGVDKIYGVKW